MADKSCGPSLRATSGSDAENFDASAEKPRIGRHPNAPNVRCLCATDVRPSLGNDRIGQATEVQPARSRHGALMMDPE